MTGTQASPDAAVFLDRIAEVEHSVTAYAAYLKKLKSRLSRARKQLTSRPDIAAQMERLLSDLNALKPDPTPPVISELTDSVQGELKKLRHRLHESFPTSLHDACEAAGLDFSVVSDGFAVGPFFVSVNRQKESASFHYAKMELDKGIPLSTPAIVEQAHAWKQALLDTPVDVVSFGDELDEAMRVAVARQKKPSKGDLRVDLPAVFNEMVITRGVARTRGKGAKSDYSRARFVVELKQFIQSTQNLEAERQFHLETAVLENTKNPKKSVFLPRDLECGYGEGTYFQAILLR